MKQGHQNPKYVHVIWESWTKDAACGRSGVDPDIFFPEPSSSEWTRIRDNGGFTFTERRAKTICASCPVRAECLRLMYSMGEQPGVWGGTLERERRRYRYMDPAQRIGAILEDMDEQAIHNGFKKQEDVA